MTDAALGYQYVVIRAVPVIQREEFVNVAVIVHCRDAGFLRLSAGDWAGRVRCLSANADLARIEQILRAYQHLCDPPAGHFAESLSTSERYGLCAAPRSTVVQPGPSHGGTTTDPAATLAELVRRYV